MRLFQSRQLLWVLLLVPSLGQSAPVERVDKGRDVGDGMVLYDIPYDPKSVKEILFLRPTVAHPFYEIVIPMGDWTEGSAADVASVVVNGVTSDSYYTFVNGFAHVQSGWITRKKSDAPNVVLVTRSAWHNGASTQIDIVVTATDAEGKSQRIAKSYQADAPKSGGAPEGWGRYQSLVARDKAGLERINEPIEVSLTARAEDCGDMGKELRLFAVNEKDGSLVPIPFQTFNPRRFAGTPPGTQEVNYLQHPSQTIECVFPASVGANKGRVYVFFYGNPTAEPLPPFTTDLVVEGPDLGAIVKNWFQTVELSDQSGQIAALRVHTEGRNSVPKLDAPSGASEGKHESAFPMLTNSLTKAVHWNPDSFTDRGSWGHTFSWNPPDRVVVTTRGPLLFRITNSGRMPGYTPEVDVSVSYSFFAGVPYALSTTVMEVRDPVNASALRNGEVVLDSHLVTHFVWKEKTGEIQTLPTLHGPNWQDEWGYRVDHDVPWIAMTNELDGFGVGTAITESTAFNPKYGNATIHRPAFYLYYHHFWSLPLTYFTRGWMYPFSDYQRGPIIPVQEGSTYMDRSAYTAFVLKKETKNRYAEIDGVSQRLMNPLEIRWGR